MSLQLGCSAQGRVYLKFALREFALYAAARPVRNRPLAYLRKVRMNEYIHVIRNMKQQKCVFNQCKQLTQAIAATDSCRLGQSDHVKSEHLPGGRNRAAAAMPLRFTSAMQTRTQDATPELAKQTGCQRAPGKVQLRLDLIQRPPCYTTQPARFRAKTKQA